MFPILCRLENAVPLLLIRWNGFFFRLVVYFLEKNGCLNTGLAEGKNPSLAIHFEHEI